MNVQKVTTLNQNGTATVNRQPSLGILGGAFDPVHNGHLKMARVAMEEGGLDKVIFIPVAVSPLKTGGPVAESQARLAMLEIALADYPDYVVSGIELDREGISYTIDTLRELREDYGPAAELTLIIGMDNFLSIAGWRDIESLIEMSKFIIISRPGFKINRLAGKDKYWADK
ncbi:MAG: nicotinate (nicotinamide) nucleotide adenylyltransferase, partial [Candidatus Auribacterota bacterium]|nr:nicotinate (nicotinamide) nucleotide adenylyltransferase [Candidatus Auribacterota bacterium]